MSAISIDTIFGNVTSLEKATGLNATVLNSLTLTVLIVLCVCDILICCFGTLCCCYCICCRNRSRNNSYQINRVERSSHIYPKISRLSRVSNSTTGGMEMEWVQTQRYSQASDVPLHQSTAKVSMQGEGHSYANMYPHLSQEDRNARMSTQSGYVVMDRAKLDANYDDVKNVRPNFYEDIMDSVPRVYEDRDTYDDVSNVRAPSDYEDVLNVRIDPSKDKLI